MNVAVSRGAARQYNMSYCSRVKAPRIIVGDRNLRDRQFCTQHTRNRRCGGFILAPLRAVVTILMRLVRFFRTTRLVCRSNILNFGSFWLDGGRQYFPVHLIVCTEYFHSPPRPCIVLITSTTAFCIPWRRMFRVWSGIRKTCPGSLRFHC